MMLTTPLKSCALFVSVLMLAACTADGGLKKVNRAAKERNPAPCPNVLVLQEAGDYIEFAGEQKIQNVAYTGEITSVETSCRYYDDLPIEAGVKVSFALGKGPAAESNTKNMQYFVAVTRSNRELIAKETFDLPVNFKRGDIITVSDVVDKITIPRKDAGTSGTNFEIMVGFVLTKEQAIYNRSGKSLKFPDLK